MEHDLGSPGGARSERRASTGPSAERRRARAGAAFSTFSVALLLAAFAALALLSGGYVLQRTVPVLLVVAVVAVVAVWRARGLARPPRSVSVALLAFTAFTAWSGASILWSSAPDASWASFNVTLLYLLVLAAVAVLPISSVQLRLAARGFAVVVFAVSVYALLGKVVPDVVTHANVFARLAAPIGYWNVLAALIVMAVPVYLTTAADAQLPPWARGLAAAALVLLGVTFFFTFSRGAYAALAAALLTYFIVRPRRLSAFASLTVVVALVGALLLRVRDLATLFSPTVDDALRASQGHALAVGLVLALVAAFAAQALLALAERRWPLPVHRARLVGGALIATLVVLPLIVGTVYVARQGGQAWISRQYRAVTSPAGPSNDAQRLTSLGGSGRGPWYRSAVRGFVDHPVLGTGAGTFELTNYLHRPDTAVAKHSHSQWLNVLSELGIVGFVLFVIAVGGLVAAAFRHPSRYRDDPERPLLAACQGAVVAFIVHISLDWGWDMTSITIAFLLLTGVTAGYIRDRASARPAVADGVTRRVDRRRATAGALLISGEPTLGARILATAVLAFAVACWTLPYLAERATVAAQEQLSRGETAAAAGSATRAAGLDPLSIEPLLTLAEIQAQAGRLGRAADTLGRAMRLQPANYEPYYRMGELQQKGYRDVAAARAWYEKALELNPMDPRTKRALEDL